MGLDLEPMLCTLGPLPADEARWAFEPKWDGFRALVPPTGPGCGCRAGRAAT